jgi:hypothetical protein
MPKYIVVLGNDKKLAANLTFRVQLHEKPTEIKIH